MRSEANLNVQKSKATGPAIILDSKYLIPSMFRGYIHCRLRFGPQRKIDTKPLIEW